MCSNLLHRFIAGALIVLLPAAVLSADAGTAMLTAGQNVTLNGRPVRGREAVLPGDRVRNAGDSTAVLAVPGGTVTVGAHSSLMYQDNAVQVTEGAVSFRTQSKLGARYQELSLQPLTSDTHFVVGEINGKRVIAALHGSVVVSDGVTEATVPEGKAMTQDTVPTPPMQGKNIGQKTSGNTDKQKRGGKRGAAWLLPGWAETAIIGGVIGGVFGGLYLAGYFDKASQ